MKNMNKSGSQGDAPLGVPPPLTGERGVTLLIIGENK